MRYQLVVRGDREGALEYTEDLIGDDLEVSSIRPTIGGHIVVIEGDLDPFYVKPAFEGVLNLAMLKEPQSKLIWWSRLNG